MPKYYYGSIDWNQQPVTLIASEIGLAALEFKRLVDMDLRRFAEKPMEDSGRMAPYLKQVEAYFEGKQHQFDLPLDFQGTDFQKRIWRFLITIPYGKVASYQQAAQAAGNEKAVRAAGMANNKNPISVVIPCHRVVGKDGSLTGYGGGLHIKEALLKHEGIQVDGGRIREASAWLKTPASR
ncbi:methylated-DNA--[protein]-cysteine S-methyltransferase [Anoxynatronum buryatiense]|uniref:Methylated-DNA--protein-cysteine methyltransferase n=1 Tax=Anoxynatronum buryatiense TaxID=489973 RepID=A0AA46AHE1_9CLOT|nr:methylated-DNA--[protein]-cysteine S-methyltransferase [Anoxynatronum buryatiense]SMP39107.1 methylated-DNA-[protein]-cysteine S-methyltransferase/methylated-DNA-[protein]-cysteine S-methyltransferase [Anoxynatronum buryatiense]